MPIRQYETGSSQALTMVGFTQEVEYQGDLAWAEVSEPEEQHSYALPLAAVGFSVTAVVVMSLTLLDLESRPQMPPVASAPPSVVPPPAAPPIPPLPPPPVITSPPEATPEQPPQPEQPNPATQDSEFLNDLSSDGMTFPYGTAAVINEGHAVCERLAGGEPKVGVIVDVIAGSAGIPGHNLLTIHQARHLVDDAITIYCTAPVARVPVVPMGPGHYTIA